MTLTGKTVLLVEADFSGNALSGQLDAGASQGLAAILEGTTSLKEAAVPTGTKGLSFLPCGKAFGNSADLVASRAFSEFLYDAAEQYDYVLCVLPGEEGNARCGQCCSGCLCCCACGRVWENAVPEL